MTKDAECLNDYSYTLPTELIAQKPVVPRDTSKLLVVRIPKEDTSERSEGQNPVLEHKHFGDILDYLQKDDVLVLNNTKVMPNKIYGKKETGAKASIIIEGKKEADRKKADGMEHAKDHPIYKCRIEANNPKIGNILLFDHNLKAEITGQDKDYFFVKFSETDMDKFLKKYGKLPTPSYVKKMLEDDSGYQTEYAKKDGSLAAPTSGLHFTKDLLDKIEKKGVKIVYVTLHISFGTFARIDEKKPISEHKMSPEYYEISKETADAINNRKGRLVICGTTAFKSLESAAEESKDEKRIVKTRIMPKREWSELFIYPGHKFKVKPDLMITNFHLPKSTLILLVSAYFGKENILYAYNEAVKERYRFFSLGDSTLFIR
jgi:S-adenosylmethionine:tRNA ribosyltransferase-isomerase